MATNDRMDNEIPLQVGEADADEEVQYTRWVGPNETRAIRAQIQAFIETCSEMGMIHPDGSPDMEVINLYTGYKIYGVAQSLPPSHLRVDQLKKVLAEATQELEDRARYAAPKQVKKKGLRGMLGL